MRLYYSGESKNKIGYTVDSLEIEGNGRCFQYDLRGEQSYDLTSLNGRLKGDIYKWVFTDENGEDIEFEEDEELTEEDEDELFTMLEDDSYEKILHIWPEDANNNEENELFWDFVDDDELTDVEVTIELGRREATFKCITEIVK